MLPTSLASGLPGHSDTRVEFASKSVQSAKYVGKLTLFLADGPSFASTKYTCDQRHLETINAITFLSLLHSITDSLLNPTPHPIWRPLYKRCTANLDLDDYLILYPSLNTSPKMPEQLR